MSVVSNTTPLNYLILIGRVEILRVLHELVVIPEAVYEELTSPNTPKLVRDWILDKPDWLRVQETAPITDSKLDEIQIGERQAIVLAQQIRSEFIILDDRRVSPTGPRSRPQRHWDSWHLDHRCRKRSYNLTRGA